MTIVLSKNSDEPIYTQIFTSISRQILSGELEVGTQLPPIRTVAADLRISVIPVKMAWEELDRNGFIKTIVGKGTFVAELHQTQLDAKKSENLQKIVHDFCIKIQQENISLEEAINVLKEEYANTKQNH